MLHIGHIILGIFLTIPRKELDEYRERKRKEKRRGTSKRDIVAKLQKAVDIIRAYGEIDIHTLAFKTGVSPYFLGRNAGLMMDLFEDVRFDPYANTFYVVRRFSRCPDPPSCPPDRKIRKREKEREKES